MRILLDECMPRELAAELAGHEVATVRQVGWAGLKNGQLLKRASGRYRAFLTVDKRIGHEHIIPANLAVVTIRARSNRIQDLRPLIPHILQALKEIRPGKSTSVGRSSGR